MCNLGYIFFFLIWYNWIYRKKLNKIESGEKIKEVQNEK